MPVNILSCFFSFKFSIWTFFTSIDLFPRPQTTQLQSILPSFFFLSHLVFVLATFQHCMILQNDVFERNIDTYLSRVNSFEFLMNIARIPTTYNNFEKEYLRIYIYESINCFILILPNKGSGI